MKDIICHLCHGYCQHQGDIGDIDEFKCQDCGFVIQVVKEEYA